MVGKAYGEPQLDALRELANIGSGTAATSLSAMVGRSVSISVPRALVLPLADLVAEVGPPEALVAAVELPLGGELQATALLVFARPDADALCKMLDVDPRSEIGVSALAEIGNILGSGYAQALGLMTGLAIRPGLPQTSFDMLGAVVSSALAPRAQESDVALLLDSEISVSAGCDCELTFLLVPESSGVDEILEHVGL